MKIIFSPTKTMKKTENNYESTIPLHIDKANELDLFYNVMKDNTNQAIFFYNGISFKYLDVLSLNKDNINYLNKNLYILSALYGVLSPLDLINEYRLDFTNKTLYDHWNIKLNDIVINLASIEYSKMIKCNNIINIHFKELKNDKLSTSSTYSKMLRGLFLRYMTLNEIEDINELKKFEELGYTYNEELSNSKNLVYVKM